MIAKYIQIAIGTLGRQLVRIKKGRALMASGLSNIDTTEDCNLLS